MKKKEIEKIENKLTDTEVPDSVLNLARAEMSQNQNERKPIVRRFNLKYALSCVASVVLCLAIILPITLTSFDNKDGDTTPSDSMDGSQAPPSGGMSSASPNYKLEDLRPDKEVTGGQEPEPPEDTDYGSAIKYLSRINYTDGNITVISKETYSVYGEMCEVYVLYDSVNVDVLEPFENFTDEFFVSGVRVKYKINDKGYLSEAYYSNKRYCFTGTFAEKSIFEEFCQYLFK